MAATQYHYQACDAQGTIHKGILNAENQQEVLGILQTRHLIPVKITETTEQIDRGEKKRGIVNQDIIDFTNGLCTLVESHVPLDKAMLLLEGITNKPPMKSLIIDLRREIKEGHSLADALQNHSGVFSRMYINMVHAGEEGGILDKLLPRLASFLSEADEARRTVISALIYPAILAVVGVVSVVSLLLFVVPQFATLFEDMGSAIPDSAAFLLNLPLLGSLLLEAEASRVCRTLGAVLASGIPLLKGLHIARGVMENYLLASRLVEVEETVRKGVSLGKALTEMGIFPILLAQLVIVGEESGRTAEILEKLAESFDAHVKQKTGRLVALVEPLLIVVLGGVVGGVVVVMFSAIFSINDVNY